MPKAAAFAICAVVLFLLPGLSRGETPDCSMCHPDKAEGKVVHPAVSMGCTSCHSGVDASQIPHAFTGEKGLSSGVPDLCFGCHGTGAFTGKTVHMPVTAGMCLQCHSPHTSENAKLLLAKGNALGTGCHGDIKEGSHVTAGHPLKGPKDPKRPGEPFGCVSCHNPHASSSPTLFRYEAQDAFEICGHCHEF
jgi:predicted CXXCH cytochrome family protein